MAAVLRDSVFYAARHVNKYVSDPRRGGGRVVPIPFEVTIVSPSTTADTYNLCVLPAGCRVVGLEVTTEAMGASAGAGRTLTLGDSGDPDRYLASLDVDALNASGRLAAAGAGYEPTADTIVVATFGVGAPVVGKRVSGCFFVIPAA